MTTDILNITNEINNSIENSKIDKDTIIHIVGYTGFSLFVCQSIPVIMMILEQHFEKINIDIDKTRISSIIIQTIAGILILIYGILETNSVIYLTIPSMIFFNSIGLSIKLFFYIKEKKGQMYY